VGIAAIKRGVRQSSPALKDDTAGLRRTAFADAMAGPSWLKQRLYFHYPSPDLDLQGGYRGQARQDNRA
jgi:hypothetical protein